MDTFTCPHCNQVIETGEQESGIPQRCLHCEEIMAGIDSNPAKQDTFLSRTPVQVRVSLALDLFVLVMTICLGALIYFVPQHHLYLWKNIIYIYAVWGVIWGVAGVNYGHAAWSIAQKEIKHFLFRSAIGVGLLLCYICVILIPVFAVLVPLLNIGKEIGCGNNYKELALILGMYANEHPDNMLPELSPQQGHLMFENDTDEMPPIYPEYITGLKLLICPADYENKFISINQAKLFPRGFFDAKRYNPEDIFQHSSYCYLSYAIKNDKEMRAFVEAYKKRIAQGLPFDDDLEVAPGTGTDGGNRLLRLRKPKIDFENISEEEKRAYWKFCGETAVMWDRCSLAPNQKEPVLRHMNRGIRVLFLDGHNEFIPYGKDRWPLTEETLRLFWELEQLQDKNDTSDSIASGEEAD